MVDVKLETDFGLALLPNGFSDLSLTEGFNVNIFAGRIMAVIG